ncbi:N-acetylneuraminate synthase family protein [Aestuariispira ectoiniformans]|uniref:N-acetylneuraminate synthase family protein n=1 Tax=Aestuariispira ectoiniformans TaxID=2775080 RepID=UPI00223B41FC|nr:N-acetylneuraminate synthase family protein [Aestuariispira ectoiniformans]
MKLFGKDLAKEVVLVAEIGVNHEGDPEKAFELMRLAAQAGADAVKFQSYTAERFISAVDPDRLERVGRFALDEQTHRELATEAKSLGVSFFSSAISEDWVPLLAELGEAIKIASGDLTFEPVIRAATESGRKVLLSTGASDIDEIDRAVAWVRDVVGDENLSSRLLLMHCVSAYPTPMEQANFLSIPFLQQRYHPVAVGYSNHVIGTEAAIAAVALGARVVEMHFTDQKDGREFRDHSLSADAADIRYLTEILPKVAAGRGTWGKPVQACEETMPEIIRKGVVAAHDLEAGTVLSQDDLMFARPASEYSAGELPQLIGATLNMPCSKGHPILRSSVERS